MEDAGLVARSRAPQARGRPRDAWTIAPDARPGGAPPSAYADLGRWLARAISARPGRLRDLEATGRDIGRELAPRCVDLDGVQALEATLIALGCQPHAEPGSGELMTYRLGNCPYRDAVRENHEAVCTLHRGITRGLLDVLQPHVKLAGFVPRDPDAAGCLIELTGVTAHRSGE
jgi:predicted ArsR family transcriptional regulator